MSGGCPTHELGEAKSVIGFPPTNSGAAGCAPAREHFLPHCGQWSLNRCKSSPDPLLGQPVSSHIGQTLTTSVPEARSAVEIE